MRSFLIRPNGTNSKNGSQKGYDELFTILTEVESIVNDRPITYVYDDVEAISCMSIITIPISVWTKTCKYAK